MKKIKWKAVLFTLLFISMVLAACSGGEDTDQDSSAGDQNVVKDADPSRYLDPITILSRPQSAAPDEYETAVLIRDGLQELGVDAEVQTMPMGAACGYCLV